MEMGNIQLLSTHMLEKLVFPSGHEGIILLGSKDGDDDEDFDLFESYVILYAVFSGDEGSIIPDFQEGSDDEDFDVIVPDSEYGNNDEDFDVPESLDTKSSYSASDEDIVI
ncbi:hypothetical protein DM860_010627 [Cuscuta australis]|uniref:Uncharacterized protein n=1 Tax=Cuscuta australis TaxID=267555 RepID=A0A328E5M8_9ASTE|nr:hypothetical protein DM860_010627 [Cuscuta australis]